MSTKRLFLIMLVLVIVPLMVFISVYQRYAVTATQREIAEHVEVIAPTFWNYDPANIEYLTLAAQANHYESIVLEDLLSLIRQTIDGPPPTPLERWLMGVKLMPLYTFQESIRYNNEQIGTLTVVWRCQTVYVISYVALCLIFIAAGLTLYIRLLGTKQELLVKNRYLQQEIAERQRTEKALQHARDSLETRVEERTAELAETNDALRKSERQFHDIVKSIPGMVYQFRVRSDGSSYFSYSSPKGHDLFGLPEDMSRGNWQLGERSHPDDRERFLASTRQSMTDETEWDYEGRLLLPDGAEKWFKGIASPTRVGEEVVFNGILLDITGRKRAEADLRRYQTQLEALVQQRTHDLSRAKEAAEQERQTAETAREKAEEANRAKSQFLANMSHELRTPLNAILGFAQLMHRDAALTEAQREHLDTISRSGQHLLTLINDVLDMSRIEAGRIPLNLDTCDLWQTLLNIEEMFQVRVQQKGLHFILIRTPEVPRYIRTDESKLRQILVNLLGNAVKFTEKGQVTLNIADTTHPSPRRRGVGGEVFLQCLIEDTGPGIAEDELESIFETFGRARQSEQAIEGTGLGLAISRQFARLMGGDITATSEPGKGSLFTLTLPVEVIPAQLEHESRTHRRVAHLAPEQPAYRILIVEDTEASRKFLSQLLQSVGFTVCEACNGHEALAQWQQQPPDFIFMDMRMPLMDGYEATRRIRAAEAAKASEAVQLEAEKVRGFEHEQEENPRRTPIIALTASAFKEEHPRILEAGCQDVLRKPVQEQEIFDILQTVLGVEYIYQNEHDPRTHNPSLERGLLPLTPEMLAALPQDDLTTLEQAAAQVNVKQVEAAIQSVRQYNAFTADALEVLAKDFKYQDIWNIIQQVRHE